MVDLVTAVIAGAVGLGLGASVSYFVFYARPKPEMVIAASRNTSGKVTTSAQAAAWIAGRSGPERITERPHTSGGISP